MTQPSSGSRSAAVLLPLAIAIAFAACGDSSGPDDPGPQGRWVIVTVDDDALPVVVGGSVFTTTYLESGEIEFRTRGRLRDTRVFRVRDNGSGEPVGSDQSREENPTYRAEGERLIVNRVYGATVYSDTGTVGDDGVLVLRVKSLNTSGPVAAPTGPGREVRYERVEAP